MYDFWMWFVRLIEYPQFPELTWIIGVILLCTVAFTSGWIATTARILAIAVCVISITGTILAHPHFWPVVLFELVIILVLFGTFAEDRVPSR